MMDAFDSQEFRRILGHYPTGVCLVTALSPAGPVGMVVGSFTSVSLEPPLVAFLPDRRSTTWPKIEAAGHFCVNILAEDQRPICEAFASPLNNRFESTAFRLSKAGLPVIEGVIAWFDCQIHAVHEAGDHFIAIGRVRALNVERPASPLIFMKGQYAAMAASHDGS